MISYRVVCELMKIAEPPIENGTVGLKLFDGSIMKPFGQLEFLVELSRERHSLQFQVVSKSNRPLISFGCCKKLA